MGTEVTPRPDKDIERSRESYITDIRNTLKDIERLTKHTEAEGTKQLKGIRDLLDTAYCLLYKERIDTSLETNE